jgi:FAD/FMN-containing dehydrogenase
MDRSIAWRAALLQGLLVAIAAVVLGALLDREFFADWGWLAGPGTWGACALATAAVLRLPPLPVLAGAAVSGVPSLVAVLLGAHWAGAPLAVILFATWCGRLGAHREPRPVTA